MSSFSAEEILTEKVKYLMEDDVYLDTALKNLIAKVFGIYSTQDSTVGGSFSNNNDAQAVYRDIMSCARFILRAFNSHSLLSYEEWAEANPQDEDNTADARFDDLINYKAAVFLKGKLEGKKYSQSLGRRYLLATGLWKSQLLPVAQLAAAASNVEENIFIYFSTEFGLSLQDSFVDADLVWSSDFQKTLKEKQMKRLQAQSSGVGANMDIARKDDPQIVTHE
mmetsp:Transcript_15733/g.26257  ORF Transcript_15733/g.26257 Transcript_15733/m.26257 type:complete len:223 (-) Transcript_15733:251-919(-)|eukprot:CAMPEP_0114415552 /NCGR_PEP_ID=MMETSP0103-20121206/1968_1 /TAXON_ID=37642 ORGANISM="Paraphysomonas imperforata, Strain PA2" /NCGR_SAMPLE_ID=MMETSP0103 /ASSEMBLY_ACC=CAM_ASM_000201 /LENGTH=222 /DNA_ID=CAMNT_0001583739 /DNA_START=147 /DNA_END=815 /DNA_ORIENTATION=-